MESKRATVRWATNRDKEVFFNVLQRSGFGLVTPDVFRMEKIIKRSDTCEVCGNRKADFRVTRNRGTDKFYSEKLCMECIEEHTKKWLERMLNRLKDKLTRYRVMEEL